jgi:hypothetical protein
MGVKNGGMWALTATSPAPLALAPANWAMWGASERLERGIGTYCLTRSGKSSHFEIGNDNADLSTSIRLKPFWTTCKIWFPNTRVLIGHLRQRSWSAEARSWQCNKLHIKRNPAVGVISHTLKSHIFFTQFLTRTWQASCYVNQTAISRGVAFC